MDLGRRDLIKGTLAVGLAGGVGLPVAAAPASAAPAGGASFAGHSAACSCAVWGAAPSAEVSAAALAKCSPVAPTPHMSASFAPTLR
jgi:hypothetical protein